MSYFALVPRHPARAGLRMMPLISRASCNSQRTAQWGRSTPGEGIAIQ